MTLALRQCHWCECFCRTHQCFRWPWSLLALIGSINDWIIHKCGPGNQKKWESNDSQSLHRNSGSHWFVTKSFQIFSPVLSPSELEIDCVMTAKFPRSYQCPPYSCWLPVIPVDSGGIPVEYTSQNFTPATKLCNSSIYTRMVPGVRSPEWHRNPVTGIEIQNSKYGNFCIFTWKIVIKSEKK